MLIFYDFGHLFTGYFELPFISSISDINNLPHVCVFPFGYYYMTGKSHWNYIVLLDFIP